MSERDLVVAFKGGDAHAYAVIYRQFRPVAESICLRILGNPEDAQEAAQETMLRVFQGLPRFNGRYLLRAWVARIATNVCLDMLRKRTRRVDEVETPVAEDLEIQEQVLARQFAEDPGEVVERLDEGRRVRRKLQELPDHHRDALLMREFDGLSHEEMAMKLGMTAPQVKALLHRAKKGFRRAWEVETGRASGFVFPALLIAPFRWIRRVVSPAKDVVADAAAPVLHLSAQPVVVQASAAVGERAAAAAGAILVAGTIGIGATALPKQPQPAPKAPQAKVIVTQPAPSSALAPESQGPTTTAAPSPSAAAVTQSAEPSPSPSREGSEPEPSPSPTASPEPQPSAQPTPTPSESPTPAPAPKWDLRFQANVRSDRSCGCAPGSRLQSSRQSGEPGGNDVRFSQVAQSVAFDADGKAAWQTHIEYEGVAEGERGNLNVYFTLTQGNATYSYSASLDTTQVTRVGRGWSYRFAGGYRLLGGQDGFDPIPRSGTLVASIAFWSDGTLYDVAFNLS